jgi:hypothetical protein
MTAVQNPRKATQTIIPPDGLRSLMNSNINH